VIFGTNIFVRHPKATSYKKIFVESPGNTDESGIEDCSSDEGSDEDDRDFIVLDESDSVDEYIPPDCSESDSSSSGSDRDYDLTDGSDSEYDFSDMYAKIASDMTNMSVVLSTNDFARQCKATSYKRFFVESPRNADESGIEDCSSDEGSDEDDRDFIVLDDDSDSADEYVPSDCSGEYVPSDCSESDSSSSGSDCDYDLTDELDNEPDICNTQAMTVGDMDDLLAHSEVG
jgi:hypothetical protein